ncbi:MAG: glucose-1-phosphate thymidylyltransferase [Bacteroidota bacterium]|nr:glucose-1-phosphate thymidylyltransferase [Bacteroidota bacterium]
MRVILFDHPEQRQSLLPFTFTRPVAAIRVGILTIAEKWPYYLDCEVSYATEPYLQNKFPLIIESENLFINGAICPTDDLAKDLIDLPEGKTLIKDNIIVGFKASGNAAVEIIKDQAWDRYQGVDYKEPVTVVSRMVDIIHFNAQQIKADFAKITHNRTSEKIEDKHTILYAPEQIFIEKGTDIRAAILNAESGPIYIGKNASVQEGAMIRGSFALGQGSCITMGCRVRGDTTIGPSCKVGGEISNSVIFGNSNKAHDGYLGNAVIGEWCNLGADTNASNLKNNYAFIKLYSHKTEKFEDTGLQFCGLMMADHSKSGINTMFNTGTVVGTNVNVYGEGFPPTFIPSFSWGGATSLTTFKLDKAIEVAERVYERRGLQFNEKEIFEKVFENTRNQRTWENKQ